jgi:large subunit ribosomal protein L23
MGILDRLNKKTVSKDETVAKKAPAKRAAKKVEATEVVSDVVTNKVTAPHLLALLSRPHVSEKAARLGAHNVYVFDVALNAEKIAIKKAVESLYNVKVTAVRTIRGLGKPVRRGGRPSTRSDWKKAMVELADGQKIDLYEGV